MDDTTGGDPCSAVHWTHVSVRALTATLRQIGFRVGRTTVRRLLRARRYSLRVSQKRLGGPHTPARDAQFRTIRRWRARFVRAGWPVLSLDTKKKEFVGRFKNAGRTWRRRASLVHDHDFARDAVGKAVPYGIYDVGRDAGFVVVGTSGDTAAFAVAALRRWWRAEGRRHYAAAPRWLLLADCGGANGPRNGAWRVGLQRLADALGVTITVAHYPSGASKWNPVEHRLFSQISATWAGEPLVSYEVVLRFIRATRTQTGLRCRACLDRRTYARGRKPTARQRAAVRLRKHRALQQWNYTIRPHAPPRNL